MPPNFSKKHISDVKHDAKVLGHRYGMAIIKWDGEQEFVSGNNKRNLAKIGRAHV